MDRFLNQNSKALLGRRFPHDNGDTMRSSAEVLELIEKSFDTIPVRPAMYGATALELECCVTTLDWLRSYILESGISCPGRYLTFCVTQGVGSSLGFVKHYQKEHVTLYRKEPDEADFIEQFCRFLTEYNAWRRSEMS